MMLFTDSNACRSRTLCGPCRDPGPAGDEWRQGMARGFALPVAQGVWPCPHKPRASYPTPAPRPPVAVPRSKWSRAARLVAKLAEPGDKGIGDTLERFLRGNGGNVYKRWFKRITGKECGCGDRQARLNVAYPYGPS